MDNEVLKSIVKQLCDNKVVLDVNFAYSSKLSQCTIAMGL